MEVIIYLSLALLMGFAIQIFAMVPEALVLRVWPNFWSDLSSTSMTQWLFIVGETVLVIVVLTVVGVVTLSIICRGHE